MVAQALRLRLLASRDVEVVEDLQMIGDELERRDQDVAMTAGPQSGEEIDQVGLEPGFRRVAGDAPRQGQCRLLYELRLT